MPTTPLEDLSDSVLEILASTIAFKSRAESKGWRDAFENMDTYMQRVGLTQQHVSKMRVLHVAGTKGKGSTCAMMESILRHCGYCTGLYTSPHLVDVRERMRISGQMASKKVFEEQFWWCYDRFKDLATPEVGVPGYFRFITLLALKLFQTHNTDVVILEVGVGGRLDATNVIPEPVACGITSLGLDHMEMLGDTLPLIAREKAGILKPGRPGFTVHQPPDAMEALKEVATAVGAPLSVVPGLDAWSLAEGGGAVGELGLGGAHQRVNAGLALQLCLVFEEDCLARGTAKPGAQERVAALRQQRVPSVYVQGLVHTVWPGRSQIIMDSEFSVPPGDGTDHAVPGNTPCPSISPSSTDSQPISQQVTQQAPSRLSFFIDGAHTPESMVTCAEWFASAAQAQPLPPGISEVQRVLVFNCMKERDPAMLLPALAATLAARNVHMAQACFVPPESQYGFLATKRQPLPPGSCAPSGSQDTTSADSAAPPVPDVSWQIQLQHVWESQCLASGHGPVVAAALQCGGAAANGRAPTALFPALPVVPGLRLQDPMRGAVAPSLRTTIEWLRTVARARPKLQLQVLVAGSLYLVGDVLRLLGRPPK